MALAFACIVSALTPRDVRGAAPHGAGGAAAGGAAGGAAAPHDAGMAAAPHGAAPPPAASPQPPQTLWRHFNLQERRGRVRARAILPTSTPYLRFLHSQRTTRTDFDAMHIVIPGELRTERARETKDDDDDDDDDDIGLSPIMVWRRSTDGALVLVDGLDRLERALRHGHGDATTTEIAMDVFEATAEKPATVLALGMAFATEAHIRKAKTASGTTDSTIRDRYRLLMLEHVFHVHIVSFNMNTEEASCEPDQHYMGQFEGGARSVRAMLKRGLLHAGQPIQSIFIDYFRMPTIYMRPAVASVMHSLLPALIDAKLVTPQATRIYIPNERVMWTTDPAAKYLRSHAYVTRPISGADNPLFVATDALRDQDMLDSLGGISNATEILPLDHSAPFVVVVVGQ